MFPTELSCKPGRLGLLAVPPCLARRGTMTYPGWHWDGTQWQRVPDFIGVTFRKPRPPSGELQSPRLPACQTEDAGPRHFSHPLDERRQS